MVLVLDTLGLDLRTRYIQSRRDGPLVLWAYDIGCIDAALAVIPGRQGTVHLLPEGISRPRPVIVLGTGLTCKDPQ